jgi:hypothetical protein
MLSRLGVQGEQEPALTSCEDALRKPPEERGSISLALQSDSNAKYAARFVVIQGYVIDLAADLPAKMGISLEAEVKSDDEQPIVDSSIDISVRGPVHSGDGVKEDQSILIRAAYRDFRSSTTYDANDDATAQVCSTVEGTVATNAQSKDLETVLWQAYKHETAPVMCAIQPQACAATAAADVIAPEGFSMQQWSAA